MTTIAVPVQGSRFCDHFGGAEAFALYTVAAGGTAGERRLVAPPEHGRGVFPMWLKQLGVEVVLAGGMGPRAAEIFARQGIEVMLGVVGGDPDDLVQAYLDGRLETGGELCHEHSFHACGHHHG